MDIDQLIDGPDLYLTTLPEGQRFAYRLLTLKEYQVYAGIRANQVMHEWLLYSQVFDRCFIGNSDLLNTNLPAGVTISIGKLIMWLSGDSASSTDRDDLEAVRAADPGTSLTSYMANIVLAAFPAYTVDDIETWTRPQLFRYFNKAEQVLRLRTSVAQYSIMVESDAGGYQPINSKDILTPEEIEEKQKVDMRKQMAQDNRDLHGAGLNQKHILDRTPDELLARQRRTNRITAAQARQLDKSMR